MSKSPRTVGKLTNGKYSCFVTNNKLSEPKEDMENQILTDTRTLHQKRPNIGQAGKSTEFLHPWTFECKSGNKNATPGEIPDLTENRVSIMKLNFLKSKLIFWKNNSKRRPYNKHFIGTTFHATTSKPLYTSNPERSTKNCASNSDKSTKIAHHDSYRYSLKKQVKHLNWRTNARL